MSTIVRTINLSIGRAFKKSFKSNAPTFAEVYEEQQILAVFPMISDRLVSGAECRWSL
jgi:hypothetical protein